MNSINAQKLEEYLSSLECPVCHKCTKFTIRRVGFNNYLLGTSGSCCCNYWKNYVPNIFRIESTRAENCELTGTVYEPNR